MNFQLKYGVVSEVKKGFVRVSFEEDEIVSDWLPVLVRRSKSEKESWQLEINEHVVCLTDQHCDEGVCLGAIPNDQDAPDPGEAKGKFRILFSDGSLIEYDKTTHKLSLQAPVIELKGQVVVEGSISVTPGGGVPAVDFTTHKHSGVQTGGGVSGPPIP